MKSIASGLFLISCLAFGETAQPTGFIDEFNAPAPAPCWIAEVTPDYPQVFRLSTENGALKIDYQRLEISGVWNNFRLVLPNLDISAHPTLAIRVKSNVAAPLNLKPKNPDETSDWLTIDLIPDNEWHTYTFALPKTKNGSLSVIYFYIDGGMTKTNKSGLVFFDFIAIGDSVNNLVP